MAPPVAGYVWWGDASQIGGVGDGAALGTWSDLSGNANDVTQSTVGQKPTFYKTTSAKLINGLPAVWFTGANSTNLQIASAPAVLDLTAATVFAVMVGDGSSSAHGFLANRPASPFSTTNYSYYTNGNQWNGSTFSGPAYAAPAAPYLLSATQTSGAFVSYENKVQVASNGDSIGPTLGAGIFEIGGSTQSGEYMTGAIGELILYPSVLSTGNRQSVENYLWGKWCASYFASYWPASRAFTPAARSATL